MIVTVPYKIVCKESPLHSEEVWRIERFLLKTFEYGNYSFRRAISGTYHKDLKCVFYLAYDRQEIIGAAGCLFSGKQPHAAILSPVCVETNYQRRGIATELCLRLLDDLKQREIKWIYLGVSKDHPARRLYHRLGFSNYTGIVMRKKLCEDNSNTVYQTSKLSIRDLSWQDYAEVSVLMCEPSSFITFDYHLGIFSSRYESVNRFLPVFPELMRRLDKRGGCAKIMKGEINAQVVGLAQIYQAQSRLQKHVAYLEFFAEDCYLRDIEFLLHETSLEFKERGDFQLLTWVPERDESKKAILENLGAMRIAMLPNTILLDQKMYNVEVFQI